MRSRRVIHGLLVVLALVLGPAALAAGPYPPPAAGSGTMDPGRIGQGECATFAGDGFAPGETVTITDNGRPVGTTTADDRGRFSYRYCASSATRPGRHVLEATGATSGRSVSAVVIVTGVEQSAPRPVSGPALAGDGGGGGQGSAGGPLAFTGFPALALVLGGTLLVTLGSAVLLLVERRDRRRRRRTATV